MIDQLEPIGPCQIDVIWRPRNRPCTHLEHHEHAIGGRVGWSLGLQVVVTA
jgi:hypothetical protein